MSYTDKYAIALKKKDYNELVSMISEGMAPFNMELFRRLFPVKHEKEESGEEYCLILGETRNLYYYRTEMDFILNFIKDRCHTYYRIGEDFDDIERSINTEDEDGEDLFFEDAIGINCEITTVF